MINSVLVCFGTRPEAIKMCTLVHYLKAADFQTFVCVTAQHREMLDQVLDFFEVKPDFDLDIMKANQSLNELSSRIFVKIDEVLMNVSPDIVLVHGDTTTSSICAWAAFHRGIKVGHVEAGLRTFNKYAPFPEEINRQITGKIADYHFAPTSTARQNLLEERIEPGAVTVTGNTVIDALFWTLQKLNNGFTNDTIEGLLPKVNKYNKVILVTTHRRENFGQGFIAICHALLDIASNQGLDVGIIFPVHLNPNVRKPVFDLLGGQANIHLIDPLDYPSFVWLMQQSYLIITDSGGVQEEAPSIGKPVLVMRETTERPEAVAAQTVMLVGADREKIVKATRLLLTDGDAYNQMAQAYNPYGDGNANKRIVDYLKDI